MIGVCRVEDVRQVVPAPIAACVVEMPIPILAVILRLTMWGVHADRTRIIGALGVCSVSSRSSAAVLDTH